MLVSPLYYQERVRQVPTDHSSRENSVSSSSHFRTGAGKLAAVFSHKRKSNQESSLFSINLRNDDVQEFDKRWGEILLSMIKIQLDDILESLYKVRIRESDQLKTVLDLYDLKFIRRYRSPIIKSLKRW